MESMQSWQVINQLLKKNNHGSSSHSPLPITYASLINIHWQNLYLKTMVNMVFSWKKDLSCMVLTPSEYLLDIWQQWSYENISGSSGNAYKSESPPQTTFLELLS